MWKKASQAKGEERRVVLAKPRWRGHMKPETSEHLNKVEGAIHGAKRLLGKHRYPDTMRTVLLSVLSIK